MEISALNNLEGMGSAKVSDCDLVVARYMVHFDISSGYPGPREVTLNRNPNGWKCCLLGLNILPISMNQHKEAEQILSIV